MKKHEKKRPSKTNQNKTKSPVNTAFTGLLPLPS
jgi:hypothetical protein